MQVIQQPNKRLKNKIKRHCIRKFGDSQDMKVKKIVKQCEDTLQDGSATGQKIMQFKLKKKRKNEKMLPKYIHQEKGKRLYITSVWLYGDYTMDNIYITIIIFSLII